MKTAIHKLILSGWALLGMSLAWTWLSQQFVYGVGHAQRPIPLVLVAFYVGAIAYWLALKASSKVEITKASVAFVFLFAVFLRGALLPSSMIQEVDPHRYLLDGHSVLSGVNPYQYAPEEISTVVPQNEQERAWQEEALSPQARQVTRWINYPEIPTIYPMGALAVFALAQKLTPWQMNGWRGVVFFAECLALLLLAGLVLQDKVPLMGLVLYGWSPLILKEFSNALHVDVFVVLWLMCLCVSLHKQKWLWAYVFLALSCLVKWVPAILIVPLTVWVFKQDRKAAGLGVIVWMGLLILGILPFVSVGLQQWEGLSVFATEFRVNSFLFDGLRSSIRLFSPAFEPANTIARGVTAMLVGAWVLGLSFWLWKKPLEQQHLWTALMLSLAGTFLLLPQANPWYFAWVLPLLAMQPKQTAWVWLSLALGLYYLDFYMAYQGRPELFVWVRWVEYGSFFMVLLAERLRWRPLHWLYLS